jgi:cephalosporin hydroxylase
MGANYSNCLKTLFDQEVIYYPAQVIVETGVAMGLPFITPPYEAMERGRVIGIDFEIRPHNRLAIEEHPLASFITLIEGNSIDPIVIAKVKEQTRAAESVLVLLDSGHSKEHVLAELNAYAPLVSPGSYIVAMDGIMQDLAGAPRSQPDWTWNNPCSAAIEFVNANHDFRIEEPVFSFNEGNITKRVTYWPTAFVKRVKQQEE